MKKLFAVTLVLLSFAFTAAAEQPQDNAASGSSSPSSVVSKPVLSVGDKWVFRRVSMDPFSKVVASSYEYEQVVTRIGDGQFEMSWRRPDKNWRGSMVLSDSWELIEENYGKIKNVHTYKPGSRFLEFPLGAKKSWSVDNEIRNDTTHIRSQWDAKVLGWEDVSVDGKVYRSMKIEMSGITGISNQKGSYSGRVTYTLWYSPEVKRHVKTAYQAPNELVVNELVSADLKK